MSEATLADILKNAEGYALLPAGPAEAVVDRARGDKTKDGSKGKIAAMFKIDGGPNDGRTIWNDFTISPESGTAMGFFQREMTALLGDSWVEKYGAIPVDALPGTLAEAIVGCRATITIIHEEYPKGSGNVRAKVKGVKASDSALPAPPTAAPAGNITPNPTPAAPKAPF